MVPGLLEFSLQPCWPITCCLGTVFTTHTDWIWFSPAHVHRHGPRFHPNYTVTLCIVACQPPNCHTSFLPPVTNAPAPPKIYFAAVSTRDTFVCLSYLPPGPPRNTACCFCLFSPDQQIPVSWCVERACIIHGGAPRASPPADAVCGIRSQLGFSLRLSRCPISMMVRGREAWRQWDVVSSIKSP